MTARPAWADALSLIDYGYYTLTDLLFLVFAIMIVSVVSRPGLRQHLRWANASAASCVFSGCGRFVRDMHFFFGMGSRWNSYLFSTILYFAATALGFYAIYLLWRTLHDIAQRPASPDPLAEQAPPPGVWPPPPAMKR